MTTLDTGMAVARWGIANSSRTRHAPLRDRYPRALFLDQKKKKKRKIKKKKEEKISIIIIIISFSLYVRYLCVCLPEEEKIPRKHAHCLAVFDNKKINKKTFIYNVLCI